MENSVVLSYLYFVDETDFFQQFVSFVAGTKRIAMWAWVQKSGLTLKSGVLPKIASKLLNHEAIGLPQPVWGSIQYGSASDFPIYLGLYHLYVNYIK